MTRVNLRLPPGIELRPITKLDCWRLSQRTILPKECLGFIASKGSKDIMAAMAALGHGDVWWIAAWFLDETLARYKPSVYRIALMWLAGLKAAGLGPLLAIPEESVSETWFSHLGFVRNGAMLDGREVFEWQS